MIDDNLVAESRHWDSCNGNWNTTIVYLASPWMRPARILCDSTALKYPWIPGPGRLAWSKIPTCALEVSHCTLSNLTPSKENYTITMGSDAIEIDDTDIPFTGEVIPTVACLSQALYSFSIGNAPVSKSYLASIEPHTWRNEQIWAPWWRRALDGWLESQRVHLRWVTTWRWRSHRCFPYM